MYIPEFFWEYWEIYEQDSRVSKTLVYTCKWEGNFLSTFCEINGNINKTYWDTPHCITHPTLGQQPAWTAAWTWEKKLILSVSRLWESICFNSGLLEIIGFFSQVQAAVQAGCCPRVWWVMQCGVSQYVLFLLPLISQNVERKLPSHLHVRSVCLTMFSKKTLVYTCRWEYCNIWSG